MHHEFQKYLRPDHLGIDYSYLEDFNTAAELPDSPEEKPEAEDWYYYRHVWHQVHALDGQVVVTYIVALKLPYDSNMYSRTFDRRAQFAIII